MSANMGRKTNTVAYNSIPVSNCISVGMIETSWCKYCGENKGTKAHKLKSDRCSKALQAQYLAEKEAKEDAIVEALMIRFGCAA